MVLYEEKKLRLMSDMKRAAQKGSIGLGKDTSNLFRDRKNVEKARINVRDFNQVIGFSSNEGWVDVEGMTTYESLVCETLKHGCMPAVVPQLKTITIGGALVGVGIEATSFRHGLVHESIIEVEVLLPDGRVVLATKTNEHRDLFYALPNSYGTLGYALRIRAKTIPVLPYVEARHEKFTDASAYFAAVTKACASSADFVDGVIFSPTEMVLTTARFVESAPSFSDYTYMHVYYRSLQEKSVDYLTVHDYIWRWDTDWFWCSKAFGLQHAFLRLLAGRKFLNSATYNKILRLNVKWGLGRKIDAFTRQNSESVIQDIMIPIENAEKFLAFLFAEIGITPIWMCPTRAPDSSAHFPLYNIRPETLYVDFGFWDILKFREQKPEGFFNRKIERKTTELGGIKSLYSEAFYPEDEFWAIYNKEAYDHLKAAYDPNGKLRDIYRKCVLRE